AQDIRIEDVPEPTVEKDGVIIKVHSCGICGSDLHSYKRGHRPKMTPGHEFGGEVVEVGPNVKDVKIGDRVAVMSGRGCGECYWCQRGDWIRCSKMALLGIGMPGAFAEYVSVPNFSMGLYATRLPESVSFQQGATAEPLSVALHAVNQVQPQPGDTAVVIGLGIIGLCIVQILKSMGVSRIIASGRRAKRLQLAKEGGADVVIDAAAEDALPVVAEISEGKGADVVFEVAGTTDTFQQSLKMVHRGGKIDIVGLYQEPITWNPSFIVSNDITIFGCGLRFDLPGAVELLESGKVDTRPLVTHQFPLEKVKEAFATQAGVAEAIKVLVNP
ncbi:MAG: alcohol dehydrogenase catalytic domain-containing protein, partial [Dehalococcoidales bacterium]